ncbi:MAG: C1 family peptidase [Tumebacillaceae bacterium]
MKKGLSVLAALPILALSLNTSFAASSTQPNHTKLHPTGVLSTPLGAKVEHVNPATLITPAVIPTSYVITTGLPPVGDEGSLNSAVEWSTAYYQKSYGHGGLNPITPSTQYSPAFVYYYIHNINDLSYPSDAYNLLRSQGCTTLDKLPYDPNNPPTSISPTLISDATLHKNVSTTNIFQGVGQGTASARSTVKSVLYGNGSSSHTLVGVVVPIYPEWDNAQTNNNYVVDRPKAGETSRGNTMVTILGYDDTKLYNGYTGAFKVVNQWGTTWGNAGYTWISYDFFQNYVPEAWYANTGTL